MPWPVRALLVLLSRWSLSQLIRAAAILLAAQDVSVEQGDCPRLGGVASDRWGNILRHRGSSVTS